MPSQGTYDELLAVEGGIFHQLAAKQSENQAKDEAAMGLTLDRSGAATGQLMVRAGPLYIHIYTYKYR